MLLRLAGVPEEGAAAAGGPGGWRWAQANLPAPEESGAVPAAGLRAVSGAEACLSAAAPDFVAGVEGESRLVQPSARGALAPDPSMASWLACGAALSGARVLAEAGPAESEAAARWCREARLAVVFIGGEPPEPIGPARLAELVGDALRDAEAVSVPCRVQGGEALRGV
ncbi:MAG: hypothetical protein HY928_06520, partial [Elusimicrobia bacterium]|nr:hypothetical protein [Elusimicrobiota bacterium]